MVLKKLAKSFPNNCFPTFYVQPHGIIMALFKATMPAGDPVILNK